jgi:hypothetical protein
LFFFLFNVYFATWYPGNFLIYEVLIFIKVETKQIDFTTKSIIFIRNKIFKITYNYNLLILNNSINSLIIFLKEIQYNNII